MSAKSSYKDDGEEEYVVTNLDDGEKYSTADIHQKFNLIKISEINAESKAESKHGEEEVEDEGRYNAKQDSLTVNRISNKDGLYNPLSIPDGGRLTFVRISAVGSTRDADAKVYSVYYLDVRCNIASPSNWFVYRRYSQFRRLSDVLRSEGYIVPVLPPKQVLNTFNLEFLKQRKADLEKWLFQLLDLNAQHKGTKDPQVHPFYRIFLTEDANKPPLPLSRIYPEASDSMSGSDETEDFLGMSPLKGQKVGLEDFELIRVIGKGSFGKVTLVRKKTDDKMYAMKVLSKTNIIKRKQVEHTKTERRVLGTINHPFIVRLHYAFQTEDKLFFVLDYAAGGELFFHLSRMKKFSEAATRFYCAEITLALEELHAHDVVYRDLKPENILLDGEGHIKLVDFGLAKEGVSEPAEGANSLCGTPEYLSPEVLNRQGHGTAVDWWNLGMVTYEMLTGLPPWYTTDRDKLFEALRSAPLKFPMSVNRTAALFIQALLNRNPNDRLGAGGGVEVRSHTFFNVIDWNALYCRKITPPFNPCKSQSSNGELDFSNFEKEFTSMPVVSIDETANHHRIDSDTFLNFTYEEESYIDSLRADLLASRRK
mmetsp:Transcript_1930/g.2658  ORF Transcript_1930/g.2658 Transcript_1930/m.2658 type:complete len:595 (+) Transcript_1930:77-1861(+)